MTRDGAVAENLTTGETTSISERPQEENYSQAPTAAAEKAVDRIGAEVERQAAKGAGNGPEAARGGPKRRPKRPVTVPEAAEAPRPTYSTRAGTLRPHAPPPCFIPASTYSIPSIPPEAPPAISPQPRFTARTSVRPPPSRPTRPKHSTRTPVHPTPFRPAHRPTPFLPARLAPTPEAPQKGPGRPLRGPRRGNSFAAGGGNPGKSL